MRMHIISSIMNFIVFPRYFCYSCPMNFKTVFRVCCLLGSCSVLVSICSVLVGSWSVLVGSWSVPGRFWSVLVGSCYIKYAFIDHFLNSTFYHELLSPKIYFHLFSFSICIRLIFQKPKSFTSGVSTFRGGLGFSISFSF